MPRIRREYSIISGVKLYRLAFLVFGIFFITLPQLKYIALSTGVADLGFFISNFATVIPEWQRAFYGHVQPLMLLFGFGYKLIPASLGPASLLLLQSTLLLGSAYLIMRYYGPVPGIALLMYPPFWANNLFDFHMDVLAVPILTLFFIACKSKKYNWSIFLAGSLVLIKEPFALQTIACGIYLLWIAYCERSEKYSLTLAVKAIFLMLFGWEVFIFMVNWLIPFFGGPKQFAIGASAFSWLGRSYFEVLITVISSPVMILKSIFFVPEKLKFLFVCFGPLLFISFLRPSAIIVAIPPLLISLLSSFQNNYGYGNHYTAGIIIPLIVSFADGLPVANKILLKCVPINFLRAVKCKNYYFNFSVIFIIFFNHILFGMSPVSRLFILNKTPAFGWSSYVVNSRSEMIKDALIKYIPSDRKVFVSSQNSLNWHLLSTRVRCLPFPMGVIGPYDRVDWGKQTFSEFVSFLANSGQVSHLATNPEYADYVVIDLKRPYFLGDIGCEWAYGECQNQKIKETFLDSVKFAISKGVVIFQNDGFIIIKENTQK